MPCELKHAHFEWYKQHSSHTRYKCRLQTRVCAYSTFVTPLYRGTAHGLSKRVQCQTVLLQEVEKL